jgi:hypothetical protein
MLESKAYEQIQSTEMISMKLHRSDIFRLENLSVWRIPAFRYGLPMINLGHNEFETLEKPCRPYLRNIKTAINYFLQTFRI